MKLGIDFGTNRTVVAAADRGNYPLVSFETSDGGTPDWIPSLIAVNGDQRRYGWAASDVQGDDGWTVLRSLKRLLEDAGPQTALEVGEDRFSVGDLLNGFAHSVAESLRNASNLGAREGEMLEAVLGVPAHANTNQRFMTVEAFRAAGFDVLGVLNEPSAASIEFGHRQQAGKGGPETILVYDLGGGTFDASLVTIDEHVHHVLGSEGISTLGGDDFDQILAEMALEAAGIDEVEQQSLSPAAWFRLLDECRTKKEALNPNSRRLVIDLDHANPAWKSVNIPVADFYELARPLLEETVSAADELMSRHEGTPMEALYITGGGSELPIVGRLLRERFGRRVRRSAYARSATAIGLAIQADHPETYRLSERLARHFGVWREAEAGSRITFDPLFAKGISLPSPGEPPLEIRRSYTPVHNVGHFRFLECSHLGADGKPTGEVNFWDRIEFPFDPALHKRTDLANESVDFSPVACSQVIEETYICDGSGCITVQITNRTTPYARDYRLGHWAQSPPPKTRKRKRASA